MKEKYAHLALLGVGAVVVLWYLLRHNAAASAAPAATSAGESTSPNYPNSQPIKLGDLNMGDSPLSITYNQSPVIPTVSLAPLDDGGGCCDDESCAQITALQTKQTVPAAVFQSSLSNLQAFASKGPQVYKVVDTTSQQAIIARDQEF